MKILIINPNTNQYMTRNILDNARSFVNSEYEVDCINLDDGPNFIETYEDIAISTAGMIKALKDNLNNYDAFIIACGYDPNLDLMKEITSKPLIGIAEASIKMASMLGHKFSILSTDEHSVPIKEDLAAKYFMDKALASVRIAHLDLDSDNNERAFVEASKKAVEEDKAEVLVLGCAGLTGLDKIIQSEIGVPVLDGIKCALILASGLIKCEVSISKKRKYSFYYANNGRD